MAHKKKEFDWEKYADRVNLTGELYEHDGMHMKRQAEIAKRCEGKTLDVGAGDGYLVDMLRRQGIEADGVEISQTRIDTAKSEYGIDLEQGDIVNLDKIPDASYDTVIGSEILEHLDNSGEGLTELMRVAKKRVIISIPIGEFNDDTHQWLIDMVLCEKTSADPKQEGIGDLVLSFTRYEPKK